MARIGFVSTMGGYRWGGSEALWSQTAHRLLAAGHTVGASVIWWPEPAPELLALQRAGCKVTARRYPARGRGLIDRFHIGWLNRFRPDLVVMALCSHQGGEAWMEECRRRSIPYAIIVQAAHESYWPDFAQTERAAACYEGARACYFVSQRNLELLRTYLSSALPNARVVRNPFNVARDAAPPWPSLDGGAKIACVGRLHLESKGQDLLLEVLRSEKWRARPITATLFGSGPSQPSIEKLIRLHEMDNVTIAGQTADVEEIWRTHQMLVLPSRFEGLPLVVVEAMLCGRPCVVTDIAGNAELIEDNVTGFVAAAPVAKYLDEAMERAWARRDEWREIGAAAACEVRRRVPADPAAEFAGELESVLIPLRGGQGFRTGGGIEPRK
jgi:glycosyltransferase involved in cell wall biosynthesis